MNTQSPKPPPETDTTRQTPAIEIEDLGGTDDDTEEENDKEAAAWPSTRAAKIAAEIWNAWSRGNGPDTRVLPADQIQFLEVAAGLIAPALKGARSFQQEKILKIGDELQERTAGAGHRTGYQAATWNSVAVVVRKHGLK